MPVRRSNPGALGALIHATLISITSLSLPAIVGAQPPAAGSYRAPAIALVQPPDGGTVPQDRTGAVFRLTPGEPGDPIDVRSLRVIVDGQDRSSRFQLAGTDAWGTLGEPDIALGPHAVSARICSVRGICGSVTATITVVDAQAGTTPSSTPGRRHRVLEALLGVMRRLLEPSRLASVHGQAIAGEAASAASSSERRTRPPVRAGPFARIRRPSAIARDELRSRQSGAAMAVCETRIDITQYPASPHGQLTASITVVYDQIVTPEPACILGDDPDPATFQFKVNGVDRTSAFTAGTGQATASAVPLVNGSNTLIATITGHDNAGNPRTDADTIVVTVAMPAIVVTPDDHAVEANPGASNATTFTLQNTGSAGGTFNLTAVCSGTATSCSAPGSVTVAASASALVSVTYQAGPLDSTGVVKLRAVYASDASIRDSGWVHVGVTSPRYTVGVAPHEGAKTSAASVTDSIPFAITSHGNRDSVTYTLTRGVSGSIAASGTIPASVTLLVGEERIVYAKYTTQGTGTSGRMWLLAQRSGGTERDSGSVATSVPAPPPARRFVALSARTGTAFQYHEPGIRKTVAVFAVANTGDTTISVMLVPTTSNDAVAGTLKVRSMLPLGPEGDSAAFAIAPGAQGRYAVTTQTAGAGMASVSLVARAGAFADTAVVRDSVTTVVPTISVVGDTVLHPVTYAVSSTGVVSTWIDVINGPSPATWQLSAEEGPGTNVITGLTAPRSITLAPDATTRISTSGTMPDTAVSALLCTRIQGYGITPKVICGDVRAQPSARLVSLTNGLGASDSVAAGASAWLSGTIQVAVGEGRPRIDNPYGTDYIVEVRSRDSTKVRVVRLELAGAGPCAPASFTGHVAQFVFGTGGGTWSPCNTRTLRVLVAAGARGGQARLDIAAYNVGDRTNAQRASTTVRVIARPGIAVRTIGARTRALALGSADSYDFAVVTERASFWTFSASTPAAFCVDSIMRVETGARAWSASPGSCNTVPSYTSAFADHEEATYRLHVTATSPGAGSIVFQGRDVALIARDSVWLTARNPDMVRADLSLVPDDQRPRSSCMTFGAGAGAAWQCGELLVTHSTVPYLSRSEPHSLALLYNSNAAAPRYGITALVSVPDTSAPTKIRAILRSGRRLDSLTTADTSYYDGAPLWNGVTRRISPGLDLSAKPTGVYAWELELAQMVNTSLGTSATYRGGLVHVNLSPTGGVPNPIGAGWQLAGVERIYWTGNAGNPVPDSSLLIVEGDGSAKLFIRADSGWLSPRGDFSTLRRESGHIVRRFKDGSERWFRADSTVMVKATEPTGVESRFFWSWGNVLGAWQLDSLRDEAGIRSRLFYGSSGRLDSLRFPDLPGVGLLRAGRNGDLLTSFTDPDGRATTFSYAGYLMTSRTGRAFGDGMAFTYDSSHTVVRASGADRLLYRSLRSAGYGDGRSVATSAAPGTPGPATSHVTFAHQWSDTTRVADTLRAEVNAAGMPTCIERAASLWTRIHRNPRTLQADSVVTPVEALIAKYDALGNMVRQTRRWWYRVRNDSTQNVRTDSAVTLYEYDNPFSHVTKITAPDGVVTRIRYSGPYRDTVIVNGVAMAWFRYLDHELTPSDRRRPGVPEAADTASARRGLLKLVYQRGYSEPFEIDYGMYGNVREIITPEQHARGRGERTTYTYHTNGVWPAATTGPDGSTTTFTFDAMRRPLARTYTGYQLGTPSDTNANRRRTLTVTDSTVYSDATNTVFRYTPKPGGAYYTTKTVHDGAGRVTQYCPYSAPNGQCDVSYYDAGRIVTQISRTGTRVEHRYLALDGRESMRFVEALGAQLGGPPEPRSILADTIRFEYGAAGIADFTSAYNRAGVITRQYDGPFLRTEIQAVRRFVPGVTSSDAAAPHEMMFRYTYDRLGRVVRRELGRPSTVPRRCPPDTLCERDFVLIAPADTEKVAVRYHYDPFGRIDSVHWDGWKRRRNEALPARSFVFDFDLAGRWVGLRNRVGAGGQTNPYILGIGYNQDDQVDVFSWSRTGELALVTDTLDTAIGGGPESTRDAAGRPTLRGMRNGTTDGRYGLFYDALGRLTQAGAEWYRYDDAGAGQLLKGFGMGTLGYNALGQLERRTMPGGDTTIYGWDAAGNRRSETYRPGAGDVTILHDGFGRVASRREMQGGATAQVSAYWYDALGRRVLESDSTVMARGTVGRFFYEAAGPGAGEVIFEQRNNQELPEYFHPATVPGRASTIFLRGPMGPNHLLMHFPEEGYLRDQGVAQHEIFALQDRQMTLYGEIQPGGFVDNIKSQRSAFGQPAGGQGNRSVGYTGGQEGAGGLVFLRNRYYDPNSGSFTQEDPIGLAGGSNLYAYAGNDPVSYSDPYGLCVPWCTALAGAAIGGAAAAAGTMIYNYVNDRPLTQNLGRNTLIGAGAGAAVGLGYGLLGGAGTATAAAPVAANIDKIAAEAQAVGPRLGQQIQAAGQMVGELKLGQAGAVNALGQTLTKMGAEFSRATINGVEYVTAAMARNGVVNAIGVNADGSTFNTALKLGQKGLEVIQ